MTERTTYTVTVPEDKAGGRIDRVLADLLTELSRSRVKALIESGCVSAGGIELDNPARKAVAGEAVNVELPRPAPAVPEPEDLPLDVIHEDDHLIVVNKPAGLVVHPAAGHADGTLVNALLHHCRGSLSGIGGITRPGIVHRLDKDTSGLMVVAKNDAAHRGLSEQFAAHSVGRIYRAVVWGVPKPKSGRISGNIGRSRSNRKKMAVLDQGGKAAATNYRVVRAFSTLAALAECRLETGRTHQIRVHMASIGHPVIGDPLYGGGTRRIPRRLGALEKAGLQEVKGQALHAGFLKFVHPVTSEILEYESIESNKINNLIDILDEI